MWLASGRSCSFCGWMRHRLRPMAAGIGQCRPCLSDAEQAPGEMGLSAPNA